MAITEQALREAIGTEYQTLAVVGRSLGCTRQRVEQLVKRYRIVRPLPPPPPPRYLSRPCRYCSMDILVGQGTVAGTGLAAHKSCVRTATVRCFWCGTEKQVTTGQVNRHAAGRLRVHDKTNMLWFCDRRCHGSWLGSTFRRGGERS
jgi:ribosomal protein L24E